MPASASNADARERTTSLAGKEIGTLDNATYNLMETAAHISKGLPRYEIAQERRQGM
jgi:hypothetical protein